MDSLIEPVETKTLSEYEKDRNKPMPTLIHGAIQANLIIQIGIKYVDRYRIASEVSLDTKPDGSTPDIVLYPHVDLDFKNDPARRADAPLLTIEIQSASQSTKTMVEKLEPSFYFGIKSCWIVIPNLQAILVYDSPFHYDFFHGTDILKDNVLDIEIDLKKVFE